MDRRVIAAVGGAVIVLVAAAGCASTEPEEQAGVATTQSQEPAESAAPAASEEPKTDPVAQSAGGYVDYAQYQADPAAYAGGDVVLFFNASWCPTCQRADQSLSGADYPAGLTVVSVDYDDNTDLRQKYGVTVQHTYVQVDDAGNQLAKWTGSTTLQEIEGELA